MSAIQRNPAAERQTTGSLPVTAIVITLNAACHLATTLASVECCAERLVLDSGSTDATSAIAQAFAARLEHQAFLGYGPQKRRAVELASYDWILSLDADEALDEEALRGIATLDLSDPDTCWEWRRRTVIGCREVRYGPWGGERVLRLFNRTRSGFSDHSVHEQVRGATPPRLAPGSILHHSFRSPAEILCRSIRYAVPKAAILRAKGERTSAWMLPLRGVGAFAKAWCIQGGWRDGVIGFVVALSRIIDSTLPRALVLFDEPSPSERPIGSDDRTGHGGKQGP